MNKQNAVMETSFWVSGHRVDVLSYLFRFFTVNAPNAVRDEILATDPRYPQRVYGYQEMFRLLEDRGLLLIDNPGQNLPQFHAGEAAALAPALEKGWWLLINEQRPLTFARERRIKAVTVPEFVVYLYEAQLISYRSARQKLSQLAQNTGQRVMQAAQQAFLTLAQYRREV
jgi:hypothetical protein